MIKFSRNDIKIFDPIESLDTEIQNTPALFRASPEDALVFGGDLTRYVLSSAPITNEFKYITIDTKVHMLFPGMIPAIPGWHTDGAPRNEPIYGQKQAPDIFLQEQKTLQDENILYHLLVSGTSTEFLNTWLDISEDFLTADNDLYARITKLVDEVVDDGISTIRIPEWTWVTFDWWSLHRAIRASKFHWRYLIRITESNHIQPNTDLRKVLRAQQQVYCLEEFGW